MSDDFLDSLLGDFLDESDQHINKLNDCLLELDDSVREGAGNCDSEMMNEMFRAAHSLKGLSGMFGLDPINRLTHVVENVFDAARHGELQFEPRSVEVIFRSIDKLRDQVEQLTDSGDMGEDDEQLLQDIESILEEKEDDADSSSTGEDAAATHTAGDEATTQPSVDLPTEDLFDGIVDEEVTYARYLALYVDETEQSLSVLTDILVAAGAETGREQINELFVYAHRIKGASAAIGLSRAAHFAHFMEDVLEQVRNETLPLSDQIVDALLRCLDEIIVYVEHLKTHTKYEDSFQDLAVALLDASHTSDQTESSQTNIASEPKEELPKVDWPKGDWNAAQVSQFTNWIESSCPSTPAVAVRVVLDATQPFTGLKSNVAVSQIEEFSEILFCSPPAESLEDLEVVEEVYLGVGGNVLDKLPQVDVPGVSKVEGWPISPADAQKPAADTSSSAPKKETATNTTAESTSNSTAQDPKTAVPAKTKKQESKPKQSSKSKPQAKANDSSNAKRVDTLRVDIERLDHLMNLTGQLVINKARFTQIGDSLRPFVGNTQMANSLRNVSERLAEFTGEGDHDSSLKSASRTAMTELQSLDDELKDLLEAKGAIADLLETIHQLHRITDGLQQSVMDLRMIPIGPLFTRFRRVIRDITRGNGKEIDLEIRGEKTELDKQMIDELSDPLIHMVRNSADHGIETPQERQAAGKPRKGMIRLEAFHRGNNILIQIKDDGRGIDAEKIKSKAIEKGIITSEDAESMSDREAYQLIWEPGFSTAEQVTEISGRGMGMDIVRAKIEGINGSVELNSEPGQGTTITIKLPITLAILPSLMVEIQGDVIAFPVESVVEIVRVDDSALATIDGLETIAIRDRHVSLVSLDEIFEWNRPPRETQYKNRNETTAVVIGSDRHELAVRVDDLLGEQDIVIKSMAENYRNVRGIAGASILGDGLVSFILDVGVVIELATTHQKAVENNCVAEPVLVGN